MPDSLFQALADPIRQRIMQLIAKNELSVSELVEILKVPQSTVSRHLKVLRDAGMVCTRNAGTAALYSPQRAGDGELGELRGRIMEWLGVRKLPAAVSERLGEVVRRKRTESDDFFAKMAHRWDQIRLDCFGPAFHLEAFAALLPPDWTVADVGTGTGYFLPALAGAFKRVVAIDPVDEMLAAAKERAAADRLTNVEFRRGSATALPLGNEEVDLCVAALVLHHEPSPADAFVEFRRVVRPGGALLVIEQRSHQLARFRDLMQDRWWGFDADELARQAEQAGFAECRVQPLRTAGATNRSAPEAPELFALIAHRLREETAPRRAGWAVWAK